MAKSFPKRKPLTFAQQCGVMRRLHPQFVDRWGRGRVTWRGSLTPTSVSETYSIRIEYQQDGIPEVWVDSPKLQKRADQDRIPHVYAGPRPCLYHPSLREWTPLDPIAETIVPWTSEWLYYYELWHATGDWLGGGEPVNDHAKHEAKNA